MKKVIIMLLAMMMAISCAALAEQAAPVQPTGDMPITEPTEPEVQLSLTTGLPTDKP